MPRRPKIIKFYKAGVNEIKTGIGFYTGDYISGLVYQGNVVKLLTPSRNTKEGGEIYQKAIFKRK